MPRSGLAAKGYDFYVTTHGSFPLVGGDIGQKIAKTHRYSGTDVFWELRAEDLWISLGNRFGLVAANPDYESGMYNEWGWAGRTIKQHPLVLLHRHGRTRPPPVVRDLLHGPG